MRRNTKSLVLAVSLLANMAALAIGFRAVYLRGGWEYLQDQFLSPAAEGAANPDEASYVHRQTLFEHLPQRENAIVFAGDSLTAGCEWREFFPGAVNRGIGGDTSVGLLKRLPTITRSKPRAVLLMIGANDAANAHLRPEQTFANIRTIIAQIRLACPRAAVAVQTILPSQVTVQNEYAQAVNERLRTLADGHSVCFIDMYEAFLAGSLLSPKFTADGHHLNGYGYLVWKKAIEAWISKIGGADKSF